MGSAPSFTPPPVSSYQGPASSGDFTPPPISSYQGPASDGGSDKGFWSGLVKGSSILSSMAHPIDTFTALTGIDVSDPANSPVVRDSKAVVDSWQKGDHAAAASKAITLLMTNPATRAANGVVSASADQVSRALDAYHKGDYQSALMHAATATVPIFASAANGADKIKQASDRVQSDPNYAKESFGTRISKLAADPDAREGAGMVAGNAVDFAPAVVAPLLPDEVPLGPKLDSSITPEMKTAVAYADANNIPIDAATRTGSRAVANVQKVVQEQPGGAGVAQAAYQERQAAMQKVGAGIADSISSPPSGNPSTPPPIPSTQTPETAGASVVSELDALRSSQSAQASGHYSKLAGIENDPINTKKIQTGTKTEPILSPDGKPLLGANGTAISKVTPIMQDVALPVDMTTAKTQLKPLYDRLLKEMPVSQQQGSRGLTAIKNIIEGDDTVPASIAESNLGAIKAIQRENVTPKSKFLATQAINSMTPVVESAVKAAGPEALDALQQGRALTKAKYATQETMDNLNTEEPVRLFNQLTTNADQNINLLRDVATKAPKSVPAVGRAYIEGLLDSATNAPGAAGGPAKAFADWNKLGDQTKSVLFQPQQVSDIDNFLRLAKKSSENPNPSGSAGVAWTGAHVLNALEGGRLILTGHPVVGGGMLATQVGYMLGTRAIAKLLFTPGGAKALANGLKVPIADKIGATLAASRILKMAGKDAEPVSAAQAAQNDQSQPTDQQTAAVTGQQ